MSYKLDFMSYKLDLCIGILVDCGAIKQGFQ